MKLVDREMDRRNVLTNDLESARTNCIHVVNSSFVKILYFLLSSPFHASFVISLMNEVQTATDKQVAKEAFHKVTQKIEKIKSKQEALLAGMLYCYYLFNTPSH
jgi:hypothetical protein